MKHGENRRSVSSKAFVVMLALVLALGCAVGGTIAWLTKTTDPVTNTFTYGNIDITLTETVPENRQAKIIPGKDIPKDPKVTVKANSETCYLFVKVVEDGTFVANKVTYTIRADGWTKGDGTDIPADVYYREVPAATTDTAFYMLTGNTANPNGVVTVSPELNKDEIATATNPTLTFTAYAIQKEGFADAKAAWAKIPTTVTP